MIRISKHSLILIWVILNFFFFTGQVEASRCKPLDPTSVVFQARDGQYVNGFRIDYAPSDLGGCLRRQIISNIQPEFWQIVLDNSSAFDELDPRYSKYDYDTVVATNSGIFKIEVRNNCGTIDSVGNFNNCLPVRPIEKISDSTDEADLVTLKNNYAIEIQRSIEKISRQELIIFLTILGVTILTVIWPWVLFKIWPTASKWFRIIIVLLAAIPQFFLLSIFSFQVGGAGLPTHLSGTAFYIAYVMLIVAMISELTYLIKRLIHK